jgi:broad specificity phosphatase PhoE
MSNSCGTSVFLIRHGESLANAGHATSDPTSIPLTAQGWEQARQVAESFKQAPDLIVTSPYLRTQQTSEPTRTRFPQVASAIWPVQEFTYLSPHNCINMTATQRRPLVQVYWEQGDFNAVDGPGAESFLQLIERAKQLLLRMEQHEHQEIALFTHGQFMRMVVWLIQNPLLDWSSQTMQAWRAWMLSEPIQNGQIIPIAYSRLQGWRVHL